MSERSFVIVDPALMTLHGHMHNVDIGLQEELQKLGHRVLVVANGAAVPAVVERVGVVPFFAETAYGGLSSDPIAAEMENFIDCGALLAGELEACARAVDGFSTSALVFPTVTPSLLLAIAYWLVVTPADPRDIVAIFPTDAGFNADTASVSLTGVLFRYAFNRLAESDAGRACRLMTFTELQARDFQNLAGRSVEVCPYPCSAIDIVERRAGVLPSILFCGDGAPRKGFRLLPAIVDKVKKTHPQARFVIQVNGVTPADPAVVELRRLVATHEGIELTEGLMTRSAFLERLGEADLVMLPYLDDVYRRGSSAIFAEARYLGCPAVVTPDTLMAKEVLAHPDSGVVAASASAADLASAVTAALERLPPLLAGAAAAGAAYRARNGIDRLARLIASTTPARQ